MDNGLDKTDACETQRDPTLEELAADYQDKALRHRKLQHRVNVVGDEMWKAQERLLAAARGDALFNGYGEDVGRGLSLARQTIQSPVPTPASARLIKELAKDVVDLTGLGEDDQPSPEMQDKVEEPLSRAEEVAAELKENATAAGADDEVAGDPFDHEPGMDGPDPDPGDKMPGYPS